MPAKKDGKFDIILDPTKRTVTWSHKKAKRDPLTVCLDDIDLEFQAPSVEWYAVKGLQTHMEQRTSQDGADGFDAVLNAREELWINLCEKGHEFKEARTGGGFTVSKEVQAVADVFGVTVSSVMTSRREGTKEKWAEVIAQKKVQARVEELETAETQENLSLDSFISK